MAHSKIDRGIGGSADIVRLGLRRREGQDIVRTSVSLDPSIYELAAAVWGSERVAKKTLRTIATRLWEEDEDKRTHGAPADSSISRQLQRIVVETASARTLRHPTGGRAGASRFPDFDNADDIYEDEAPMPEATEAIRGKLVEMTLTDDGSMSGYVISGDMKGRRLDRLELVDLVALLVEARALKDQTDASLLGVYLDQHHPDWRDDLDEDSATAKEDREVLGVGKGSDAATIRMAHKRLINRVHPDTGGTNFLAARVNLAKDRLLLALENEEAAEAAAEDEDIAAEEDAA